MSGIYTGLEIGKRALLSQQTAVNVTGHNIANVNTPGFSRQRAVFVPAPSADSFAGQVGTGVTVAAIERIYDRFVAAQLSSQIQAKGRWEAETDILDQIEAVFNETSGQGLNQALNDFWNGWRDLSLNPAGAAERSGLATKTKTLADTLRDMDSTLGGIQADIDNTIKATIQEVNLLVRQLADLNRDILRLEAGGESANDLRDQQQAVVDDLAALVPAQIIHQSNGQVSVQLPTGHPLVDGSSSWQLATALSGTSLRVQWVDPAGPAVDVTTRLVQGKLGGWIEVRDTLLADYRGKLNTLATGLIKEVNRLHSDGLGLASMSSLTSTYKASSTSAALSGSTAALPFGSEIVNGSFQVVVYNSSGAVTGTGTVTITAGTTTLTDLQTALSAISGISASINAADGTLTISGLSGNTLAFRADTSNVLMALGLNTLFTGKEARDIGVNSLVQQTPDRLAAAQVESSGTFASGDNRNALAIAALQTTTLSLAGTTTTLDEFYGALLGQVGIDTQRAEQELTHQEAMVDHLTSRRDALSGVSLDEEMTNLVKFQQAYDAAAKIISVVDEMLRTVLELV